MIVQLSSDFLNVRSNSSFAFWKANLGFWRHIAESEMNCFVFRSLFASISVVTVKLARGNRAISHAYILHTPDQTNKQFYNKKGLSIMSVFSFLKPFICFSILNIAHVVCTYDWGVNQSQTSSHQEVL